MKNPFSIISDMFSDANPHPSLTKNWDLSVSWIVSAAQAKSIKNPLLLDARDNKLRTQNPVSNTIPINWIDFSMEEPHLKGNLQKPEALYSLLKNMGIEPVKPIVVFGDPISGWGEEGRIVWMLRCLGFSASYILDGGVNALNYSDSNLFGDIMDRYSFKHNVSAHLSEFNKYTILAEELKNNLNKYTILDTREKREFEGSTLYGESRGGHLPQAKWLYYKDLLDKDGFIKEDNELETVFKTLGIKKDIPIVSYCTGGVRSGWVTLVLNSLGYIAKNYPGSGWEWSALKPEDGYILTKK